MRRALLFFCAMTAFAAFLIIRTPLQAAEEVPYIPQERFSELVIKSEHPVVLQFGAEWCPYCRKVQPIVQSLRDKTTGLMGVYRINVDTDRDLATVYGVRTLPTFVYLDHGKEKGRLSGVPDEKELFSWAAKPYTD